MNYSGYQLSVVTFLPATSRNTVNELSEYYANIVYLDVLRNPYAPTSMKWRIWDATNQVQIQDWTVEVPSTSNGIDIPASANALGNAANLVEIRLVIFSIIAPDGTQRYDTGAYSVLAIPDIP